MVQVVDGAEQRAPIEGRGTIRVLVTSEDGTTLELVRPNVLYCPKWGTNILSVQQEHTKHGVTCHFGDTLYMENPAGVRVPFKRIQNVHRLPFSLPPSSAHTARM